MKKRKKRNKAVTNEVTAEKKKPNLKMLALLVVNTAVIFGFYRFMLNYPYFEVVLIAYMVIFAVLLLGYIIYNRGFSRNGITVDMLPDSMTAEEKTAFVFEAEDRKKRSKWVLTFIFPFVFTFGFDALGWFIRDNILSMFDK